MPDLDYLRGLAEADHLHLPQVATFPLEQAAVEQALRQLQTGHPAGKLVLMP